MVEKRKLPELIRDKVYVVDDEVPVQADILREIVWVSMDDEWIPISVRDEGDRICVMYKLRRGDGTES